MSLRICRFDVPSDFLDACGPFLAAREVEHNLMLGLAAERGHADASDPIDRHTSGEVRPFGYWRGPDPDGNDVV